jgi:subtilase family serine protease
MAPGANIVLIIAADNYMDSVMSALQVAVQQPGVVAVSMSFGSTEFSDQTSSTYDGFFRNNPGIAFLAAAGDSGGGIGGQNYPAASPYVTAVGGTTITALSTPTSTNVSEEGWFDGGGGSSSYESMPSYQRTYMLATGSTSVLNANNAMRAVPDVSYNADPSASPVAVVINGHWNLFGGTSAATPQWAAIVAGLAQYIKSTSSYNLGSVLSAQGGFNSILYQLARTHPSSFYNVANGQNGGCGVICTASSGYNDVTGLGVPMVSNFYSNFLNYAH